MQLWMRFVTSKLVESRYHQHFTMHFRYFSNTRVFIIEEEIFWVCYKIMIKIISDFMGRKMRDALQQKRMMIQVDTCHFQIKFGTSFISYIFFFLRFFGISNKYSSIIFHQNQERTKVPFLEFIFAQEATSSSYVRTCLRCPIFSSIQLGKSRFDLQ